MSNDVNLDAIAPGDVVVVNRRPLPDTAQDGTRWVIVRAAETRPEIAVPPKEVISCSKPGAAAMQAEERGEGEE